MSAVPESATSILCTIYNCVQAGSQDFFSIPHTGPQKVDICDFNLYNTLVFCFAHLWCKKEYISVDLGGMLATPDYRLDSKAS